MEHARGRFQDQARQLDESIAVTREKHRESRGKLSQIWQGKMKEEFAHEDVQRMLELAGRTRATMREFLQRVTENKIDPGRPHRALFRPLLNLRRS